MKTKIVVASLLVCAFACGRRDLKETKHVQDLVVPPAPKTEGQELANVTEAAEYNGGMMFWNPEVKPDDVSALFKAASYAHHVYVSYIKYFDQHVRPMKAEILEKEKKVQEESIRQDQSVYASRYEAALHWFDAQLTSSPLTEVQKQTAEERLTRYCDAKIWDAATSSLIALSEFTQRPSPSVLCEKTYAKQNRFQSDVCKNPSNGTQNYFACFWTEVAETQFVKSLYSAEKKAEFLALATNSILRVMLSDESNGFANAILGAAQIPDVESPFRSTFAVTLTPSGAKKETTIDVVTPRTVINSIEKAKTVLENLESRRSECAESTVIPGCKTWIEPNLFRFVSLVGATPEQTTWLNNISNRIQNFSQKQKFGETDASVQEVLLVYPLAKKERPQEFSVEAAGEIPEIFAGEANGGGLLDQKTFIEMARKKLGEVAQAVTLPEEGCNVVGEAAGKNIACMWMSMVMNKMQASAKPGVAQSVFPQMNLKIIPSADNSQIKVMLKLTNKPSTKTAVGCIAVNDGAPVSCAQELASDQVPLSVEHKDSGKWILKLPLSDSKTKRNFAESLGLEKKERVINDLGQVTDPSFSEKDPSFYDGKTMVFEFMPNKYENYLPYMSGDVAVVNSEGNTEMAGSLTNFVEAGFVKKAMGEE